MRDGMGAKSVDVSHPQLTSSYSTFVPLVVETDFSKVTTVLLILNPVCLHHQHHPPVVSDPSSHCPLSGSLLPL